MKCVALVALLVLVGCDAPGPDRGTTQQVKPVDTGEDPPSPKLEAQDTAHDPDTLKIDTVLNLFNVKHHLSITGVGVGASNFDRAFRIQLFNADGVVVDTLLTKASFADSLDTAFMNHAGLYLLDFDFVRSRSLYFNAFIGVDETDNVQLFDFFLTYAGPKKGRLLFWRVNEDLSIAE